MVEGGGENFEGLLMGNVSETTSETDEQFAQRVAAAQAKLQKVKKDEQKSKSFDQALAQIIPELSPADLQAVIFCINHEIPSLTILACIGIINTKAFEMCRQELAPLIEEPADFSKAYIYDPEIESQMAWWWAFILAGDHLSKTIRMRDLKDNDEFLNSFSQYIDQFLSSFLERVATENINHDTLRPVLQQYTHRLFEISR
jgi:hypothetical protein